MRIVKLLIVFLFLFFCLISFQSRFFSPVVSGQGSLAAPTGVTATDGTYSTKVGLLWDTMRGAASYRIFRNTVNDPLTATDVGTTQANYFFDASAVQNQIYFYWVRSENGGNQSGFSEAEQGRRASGNLGGGTLKFGGKSYDFTVGGLGIGGIGLSKITATGTVYNLTELAHFPGAYVQGRYGMAIGDVSTGKLWLKNSHGVVLELQAEREGLALSLGGDAVYIDLD